jgi:hypothetical protein
MAVTRQLDSLCPPSGGASFEHWELKVYGLLSTVIAHTCIDRALFALPVEF